jgi:hypothetical protein
MVLSCADEVYRYIGGTFEAAFSDPTLGPRLTESRLRVRFGFVDPDCVLFVDTETREVRPGCTDRDQPSLTVAMKGDLANDYCLGLVDLAAAIEQGEVAAYGEVQGLLDLSREGASLRRLYVERLRREGREDLLHAS